jgi:hypothetical protein
MSRKNPPSPGTATMETPAAPPRQAPAQPTPTPAAYPVWVRLTVWVARTCGSLHMAIILLSTAVVVLFLGSWLESKFDARIAQEFVYRTWWFTALLLLFAVNIFFAAAKKWPWKKHQTGFLITHVGLLTMLTGGILNSLAGVDAQMQLLDSAYMTAQRKNGVSQTSDTIVYSDQGVITVERLRQRWKPSAHGRMTKDGEESVLASQRYPFNPSVVAWGDSAFVRQGPFLVRFLDTLAHPLPRSWKQKLPDTTELSVQAYYPHAVRDTYAASDSGKGFPAVKVLLSSERLNPLDGDWIALDPAEPNHAVHDLGPARMELVGVCPDELIPDFLQPPAADKLGPKGKLVLWLAGKKFVLDVTDVERQTATAPMPLGDTQWSVHTLTYKPAARLDPDKERKPRDPCIEFRLLSPQGRKHDYNLFARVQVEPALVGAAAPSATSEPVPVCLYHPPDFLFGAAEQRFKGLLQLTQSASGKLYYRAFVHRMGHFTVGASGEVKLNQDYDIWPFMKGQFQVVRHHVNAEGKETFDPRHERLGLRRGGLYTVFRCRLDGLDVHNSSKGTGETKLPKTMDFDLALGAQEQEVSRKVSLRQKEAEDGTVVEDFYRISYSPLLEKLGFDVKLLRAESQVDPGTDRDATYSSFVLVTDPPASGSTREAQGGWDRFLGWLTGDTPPDKPVRREAMITMNQPLDYRGYKLYQSNFVRVTDNRGRPVDDDRGRPLHISGLTVGRDPGLWLKYIGSSMLALGIICMFYMRAYFFKPRSRKPVVSGE